MRALLDVNVPIALLDAAHVHHRLATAWLGRNIRHGWASCPITQLGCMRIMSQPTYPNRQPAAQVAERLRMAAADPHHGFRAADIDALAARSVDWSRMLGSRQATDSYLLALAVAKGGRFVTFDRRVLPETVSRAQPRHIEIID
jgi:toxin-antitoxin system PIN domain toxin